MSLYELLLFLHIATAIVWVGSGTLLNVLGYRRFRFGDERGMALVAAEAGALGNILFLPASIATLIFGILATIDGPWSFGDLWILIGLGGIAATIVTGAAVLGPLGQQIGEQIGREGVTPEVTAKINRLLTLARIDLVVLYVVVADMALKPTNDDVGVLVAMVLIVVAAVAFFASRAKAAEPPAAGVTSHAQA